MIWYYWLLIIVLFIVGIRIIIILKKDTGETAWKKFKRACCSKGGTRA